MYENKLNKCSRQERKIVDIYSHRHSLILSFRVHVKLFYRIAMES